MSSALTIQLDLRDFPEAPILGVIAKTGRVTEMVAQTRLHEPITTAGLASIVKTVVRMWVEPELYSTSSGELHDYLSSVGERLL